MAEKLLRIPDKALWVHGPQFEARATRLIQPDSYFQTIKSHKKQVTTVPGLNNTKIIGLVGEKGSE